MDDLDWTIIEQLQTDGRRPFTEIAKSLGVTEGTVRNRVSRLITEKLLEVRGYADPHRLGFKSPALIFVSVQPGFLDKVAEAIAELPEVSYLVAATGSADLIVEVYCRDADHLMDVISQKIHSVPGVSHTQSTMILKVYKEVLPDVRLLRTSAGNGKGS
ncbi:MAG: Lrp/AsnC family transcriptional regulator [Anaerolineales bacterium]|nr:Lrp/AsnC family transcriptional regulator [Anaerolineales bacterium]MCB0008984.1 Lrp/AsnC family transcriptional regulator [Anaerolineales bacterium]MCB0013677.1 Lrp/AsnC family transcriptional regulator [Anaerolineales bacterium]MCB0020980.1 Lrp/AsnC family transcriptional regulator [Anaerolineales bacterium]MCB0030924.1 Lrp/AsnC family transcriptional regulator [Anaerolineales bacterium]